MPYGFVLFIRFSSLLYTQGPLNRWKEGQLKSFVAIVLNRIRVDLQTSKMGSHSVQNKYYSNIQQALRKHFHQATTRHSFIYEYSKHLTKRLDSV